MFWMSDEWEMLKLLEMGVSPVCFFGYGGSSLPQLLFSKEQPVGLRWNLGRSREFPMSWRRFHVTFDPTAQASSRRCPVPFLLLAGRLALVGGRCCLHCRLRGTGDSSVTAVLWALYSQQLTTNAVSSPVLFLRPALAVTLVMTRKIFFARAFDFWALSDFRK